MKRLPARHPDWIGHLVLSSVDDSIQHEEFGRSGRYKETGDELHVFWNDHVPEIFHLDVTENIYVWLCWIDKEPKDQENLYIDKKNEETEYLFITTHEDGNALLRVQSKPLYNGLLYLKKNASYQHVSNNESDKITYSKNIIIHHDDNHAINIAINSKKKHKSKIYCHTSDIFSINYYVGLSNVVDIFVAPTDLHAEVLRSAVSIPVITVPEGVDYIAEPKGNFSIPVGVTDRICWFGYPESFEKSFRYLLPYFFNNTGCSGEDFGVITRSGIKLIEEALHINFDIKTFYADIALFRYTLLSHFAYDHHINTYIKSPNKLVTSLVRGLIPIVSNTVNYRPIMQEYGLEDWMFSGPVQLQKLLRKVKNGHRPDENFIRLAGENLRSSLAPAGLAKTFLEVI